MSVLNQLYLSELSKQYKLEGFEMFGNGFSSYYLSLGKRERVYLILCNNYSDSFEVSTILDKISSVESTNEKGRSYLCIMPMKNPTTDLCTYCNGKSFVHFIFFDNQTRDLIYDKKIYYLGSRQVKRLIDVFEKCFNDLKEKGR